MSLRLWLAVAMLAVVTPALAEQQVTPGQIEDLKEEIADIDEWLADAEEDRSSLEQQPVSYTHLTLPTNREV